MQQGGASLPPALHCPSRPRSRRLRRLRSRQRAVAVVHWRSMRFALWRRWQAPRYREPLSIPPLHPEKRRHAESYDQSGKRPYQHATPTFEARYQMRGAASATFTQPSATRPRRRDLGSATRPVRDSRETASTAPIATVFCSEMRKLGLLAYAILRATFAKTLKQSTNALRALQ